MYFWQLCGEIYTLQSSLSYVCEFLFSSKHCIFHPWLLCLMHLPLYTAVCIFDLTNLHCYIIVYMCQGVQHSGSPNVCCSLFIFLHHEACETFAYHVVTKRRCSGYYPQCSCTNHSPTLAPYLLVSNINNGITGFMVLLQAIQLGVSALQYLMAAL